jgi:Ca-activated chloride channel family protein
MRSARFSSSSLLLIALLGLVALGAQALEEIRGTVTDQRGTPLAGAKVTLLAGEREIAVAVSDARGEFVLRASPGGYAVKVELAGFAPFTTSVGVIHGQISRITASLHPAAVTEHLEAAAQEQDAAKRAAVDAATAPSALAMHRGAGGGRYVLPGRYNPNFNTEAYDRVDENGWAPAAMRPLSTFSIDVDTASYANMRRFLNQGQLPPPDAVRLEELVNYFAYEYPQPRNDAPFSVTTQVGTCPWNLKHRLALIGLQGRKLEKEAAPPRNLVFLIDVSGSMQSPQKLPLVKASLSMLAGHLTGRDRVAIVVYAGASGLVLPSTAGDNREAILSAIAELEAGGSTNGGAGLRLAYRIANEHVVRDGVNRVILATDGDFNVGVTNQGDLIRLIEEERERGVSLSVLGFGMGNYKDSTLEKLADKGNGNYAYIDSLQEAQKVLVTNAGGTLVTIAKDVKIQVEFNPQLITAYRLIGYENRVLQDQDFNDDRKDAGEIGAGHSVTVLYEIVPAGVPFEMPGIDPLKYQRTMPATTVANELMTVKLRYKAPDGDVSRLIEHPVPAGIRAGMSPMIGFASAVAEFGMLLRDSPFKGSSSFAAAAARAREYRGPDEHGHRAEFIRLIGIAQDLSARKLSMDDPTRR